MKLFLSFRYYIKPGVLNETAGKFCKHFFLTLFLTQNQNKWAATKEVLILQKPGH